MFGNGIVKIVLNRPDALNAFDAAMQQAVAQVLRSAKDDTQELANYLANSALLACKLTRSMLRLSLNLSVDVALQMEEKIKALQEVAKG